MNQACYLQESLASVARQSHTAVEHLVMDGGSSDSSLSVLREFASHPDHECVNWISEADRGQSHAINKGFERAQGEFIGWLNADDRYRSGCFTKVEQVFREHPEVDVIYGDYNWIDHVGRTTQIRREIAFSHFVLLYHRVLYIPTTATFFRRRILDAGHRLDESLHYAMDTEFFLRLSTYGYRFMHVPVLMGDFRVHPDSKSTRFQSRQSQEQDEVMKRYSLILRSCSTPQLSRTLTGLLRVAAAARRYTEKMLRGYYFSQFTPDHVESH